MKNEKGVTLIELLGALAIIGVVLTLIGSIMVSSMKTSSRNTSDQRLQQEANYITEKIRKEFLKRPQENLSEKVPNEFEVTIDNDQQQLKLKDETEEEVISEGYQYCVEPDCKERHYTITFKRTQNNESFKMKLIAKDKREYEIETKFSKLQ